MFSFFIDIPTSLPWTDCGKVIKGYNSNKYYYNYYYKNMIIVIKT